MKLFVRIAAAFLLMLLPLSSVVSERVRAAGEAPFRRHLDLADIRERGRFLLAVEEGSLAYFVHRGLPSGFEHDLVARFAQEHGAALSIRPVSSPSEAAALLRSGVVDAAVLPWWRDLRIDGSRRVAPYLHLRGGSILREAGASLGFPESGAIFVRDDSPEILAALDRYLARTARNLTGRLLYLRYFGSNREFRVRRVSGRLVVGEPGISRWDALIARHADKAGFDWRLVAALIFRESGFDPAAVSARGATGLMQLMPKTAADLGSPALVEPEANVRAGVRYLKRLSDMFRDSRENDHLAIVLAAYLLGPGHVIDAQEIARSLGLHSTLWWGGLDQVMPLLEDPVYFAHTRAGFARGRHAVDYVEQIFRRYETYRRHIGETPRRAAKADTSRGSA